MSDRGCYECGAPMDSERRTTTLSGVTVVDLEFHVCTRCHNGDMVIPSWGRLVRLIETAGIGAIYRFDDESGWQAELITLAS